MFFASLGFEKGFSIMLQMQKRSSISENVYRTFIQFRQDALRKKNTSVLKFNHSNLQQMRNQAKGRMEMRNLMV